MARGQSNYAVVTGTVVDPQHLAIRGATVEFKSVDTGSIRRVSTNESGIFEAPALLPDDYEVTTSAAGFAPVKQSLHLDVGQRLAIQVQLALSGATQQIRVAAGVDVLRATDASVGEVVEPKSIQELPLNGRMLLDLVLTVPGTHRGFGAQQGNVNPLYWRPGQDSALSIGGGRPNANFYLIDGSTNTDPTFNAQNLTLSPDAVKEFQVETNSYTADMGGAGGGEINVATRSGTSQVHATVYEFLRNGALDATTFDSMGNNHLVQNNFGGSLGGPLGGKKTFFFANYEGLRLSQTDTQILTVPTQAEMNGDFSMSGVNVYDPTANKSPSVSNPRPQFPGNVIPALCTNPNPTPSNCTINPNSPINPTAWAFLQLYEPMPNMMMGSGPDSNNYLDARNETHFTDQGTLRIDHIFSNQDTLFGRVSLGSENGFTPTSSMMNTTAQNLPGFGTNFDNLSQQSVGSWNHIFSSTKLNTVSIALSRLSMNHTSQNDNVNDIVSQLGITGVGYGGKGAWGAPWFAVQGYTGMGDTYAATPMHAWDTVGELRDAFAWQKGRHGLKFGGSYRRFIWPMWGFFENRGYYQFTPGYTSETGANDGTGVALASFLLGLPVAKQAQAGIPQMNLRNWGVDAFAEDSWQVTPTTTLNVGLRYEFESPLWDRDYTNSNMIFDNGVPSIFIGGQNGYPSGLMYSNTHNFAPRIGIAKNIPGFGLVFHAAYGIFYTPVDQNTWCNQRHNVPNVFPETIQNNNYDVSSAANAIGFNFAPPVLGPASLGGTPVSFTAFDPHAPAEYVQQWNAHIGKSLGQDTTVEVGYIGSRGFHLQQADLINNAPPGPGPIGPRRPIQAVSFVPNTVFPSKDTVVGGGTLTAPAINLLQNTAKSWYDAGYVNLRRRYSNGLSLLANYTFSKYLATAPDFRSPMDESVLPQNSFDLAAEKGPACDVRHRIAISSVYDIPAYRRIDWVRMLTQNWQFATIYQFETGMPFTISVFGDTANAGTILGENPIRANYTGQPIYGPGTHSSAEWFNPAAFAAPPAYTFGNAGRNSLYGPSLQTLDVSLAREFRVSEKLGLQIRGEAFNSLNQVNLGTPNRYVNEPQFGTDTMTMTPGRQMQLSARLSF
ncbi:MAG TPA: carboxypeptidase regulatory-like domain-containing protein [Candidatus Acidoferrales bacterium]|nr:carboxypeptidase regulatory-like domain-containing protein [Candidatus Acidoferrales bacterium]